METIKELQDKLSSLEKQKSREIIELQGIALKFEPGDSLFSFKRILKRVNDGYLNAWDEGVFASLLKCYGNLMNIENEITKTKSKIKYLEEVNSCWSKYRRDKKEEDIYLDGTLTYIPKDVELNVGMDLYEDVETEVKGIKIVELKETSIGEDCEYISSKVVPSSDTVSLEQNIKRTARQRTSHENKAYDRYGN